MKVNLPMLNSKLNEDNFKILQKLERNSINNLNNEIISPKRQNLTKLNNLRLFKHRKIFINLFMKQ